MSSLGYGNKQRRKSPQDQNKGQSETFFFFFFFWGGGVLLIEKVELLVRHSLAAFYRSADVEVRLLDVEIQTKYGTSWVYNKHDCLFIYLSLFFLNKSTSTTPAENNEAVPTVFWTETSHFGLTPEVSSCTFTPCCREWNTAWSLKPTARA